MADHSRPTKFVLAASSHLTCMVCRNVYCDPVINVKCGHTFCRQCLVGQMRADSSTKCPVDDVTCDLDLLVINRALQGQVNDLEIHCCHGLKWDEEEGSFVKDVNGCPQVIKYGERSEHEDVCEYAKVACPSGGKHCGVYQKRELESHLPTCCYCQCPNHQKGCEFRGNRSQVEEHQVICGFRGFQTNTLQVNELVQSNQELREEVKALTTRVGQTEQDHQEMMQQLHQCTSILQDLQKKYDTLAEKLAWAAVHSPPGTDVRRRTSTGAVQRTPSTSSLGGSKVKVNTWMMPFQFKCIGTLRGHRGSVFALQRYKGLLFSAGGDCVIKVWDLQALEKGCQNTLQGHTQNIMALAVGPTFLYSGGADLSLTAWSLDDFSQVHVVQDAHEKIIATMLCTDEFLFTASHTVIKVWEACSLAALHTISGLYHWVRSLALNGNKDMIYSGSHNTIEIWDTLGKFNLKGKISHTFGSVYSLAVTHQYIIAGTYNNNTHVFDVKTQQCLHKLSGHLGAITSLAVTPCGRFLFTGSTDATAQLWSLENFLPIQSLARHDDGIHTVLLYNDLFLTGSEDKEIKVFKYFRMQPGFIPA